MKDQLTVRLPGDLSRALKAASRRMQRGSSDIVRLALRDFLGTSGVSGVRPADRVSGLIGSLESGAPEGIERELRLVARRRGRSVAAVVRDAIAREVAAEERPSLSFVGVGDSGRRDVAERHEEFLWRALEPYPLEAAQKPTASELHARHRRRAVGKARR